MDKFCVTRALKNARVLQVLLPDLFPRLEPEEGFGSIIPSRVLGSLQRSRFSHPKARRVFELLGKTALPAAGIEAVAPLFSGMLFFVKATFATSKESRSLADADIKTAMQYAAMASVPISSYASQYGTNRLAISNQTVPFDVSLPGGSFNDQTLAGWTDQLVRQSGLAAESCIVFLSPTGVVNTDADATQGILGYHSRSPGGYAYIFVNVMGTGLTLQDLRDDYALALSHEIAEMTVDPLANGSNPEVCDPCGPNCSPSLRDYFDASGSYIETSSTFPPKLNFGFFINAVVRPASASSCPAPVTACAYPPPVTVASPTTAIPSGSASVSSSPRRASRATAFSHVVIIMKENHTFDNYFGTFPGANGAVLPRSSNPPLKDPDHTHAAWLSRDSTSVRAQFVEQDIPAYFSYARKFTLCDNYFTEVAGPSTPNHLMVVAADSPVIDNPPNFTSPSFTLPNSLPKSLEAVGLGWRSYGGFATKYLSGVNAKWELPSDRFKTDAASGALPEVSWVWAPAIYDEHPPFGGNKKTGNVTVGMQWTVDQINAVVKGGLWPSTAIFVTWDDWGGWYDHVNPPELEVWNGGIPPSYAGTQFRLGSRVGCLVLGPYARNGYISKVQHSHVSLVKFCEENFDLKPINSRDAASDDMSDCFDLGQAPLPPPPPGP